jgi:hypothetical protein
MKEGWCRDQYLVLFSDVEVPLTSDLHDIASILPGFSTVGLGGCADFIVQESAGAAFTVPTVPLRVGRPLTVSSS